MRTLVGGGSQRISPKVAGLTEIGWIAELRPARLPDRQGCLCALGDQPTFLFSEGGVEVQHKRIGITAHLGVRPSASLSRNEAYGAEKIASCRQTDFFNGIGQEPSSSS